MAALNGQEIKRFTEIVVGLVVGNMAAGASSEKAKEQAFNRLKAECPEVLAAWLAAA